MTTSSVVARVHVTVWNPATDGGDCRDHPELEFFPAVYDDDAPVIIPNSIAQVCDLCPVRDACLKWAMDNDAYGIWAGTSRHQRIQLGRERHRVKCPGCGGVSVMVIGRDETCLGCGISWRV